jgi:hypothetical protein
MKIESFEVKDYDGRLLEIIYTIASSYIGYSPGFKTVKIKTDDDGSLIIKVCRI